MNQIRLGKTEICVNRNGFGALPIQRIPKEEAVRLVRKAYDHGIRFFDTAYTYTDSEEKLGAALAGIRAQVFIATKTPAENSADFWKHLEESLRRLGTNYVDQMCIRDSSVAAACRSVPTAASQASAEALVSLLQVGESINS